MESQFKVWWKENRLKLLLVLFLYTICLMLVYECLYYSIKANHDALIASTYSELNRIEYRLNKFQTKLAEKRELEAFRLEQRIEQLQPKLDPAVRFKYVNAILRESKLFNLSSSLVLHIIYQETLPPFNPLSTSRKGARGPMQVMYRVHSQEIPELAQLDPNSLYHIDTGIHFGCLILRKYIDMSKSLDEALKRYVGGNDGKYVNAIYQKMAEYESNKH